MSTQRAATPRHDRPSARRVTRGTQTTAPTRKAGQAKRRAQPAGAQRRQTAQDAPRRRRTTRRSSSIDIKVVAIVAVSLAVVLGVAGFFAQRRGLLDWTGIGMRKVAVATRAGGFDSSSTPIPLHVSGERSSGVSYERDLYITADTSHISLPKGNYTVTVVASPICAGGTIFSVPDTSLSVNTEGRDAQVSGNSTGTITLDLAHLDIIDATDEQVEAAIAAAQASSGKKASEAVERNVPALQRLRQQSVLPDDMPAALVLESTMSGWSTTIALFADGSFTGTYTQLISSATGSDYPNGTAYTCTFSGSFTDVERIGDTGFRMTLGEVELDHEVGEKWVADGVLNVGAQPLGFETGSTFELWRPGTATESLGWWLSAWCNDYATAGIPESLDRWALDNVDASYGFFSEAPKSAVTADDATDEAAEPDTAVDD